MENNFKWTDELVKEFVDFYTNSQNTFASWGQDIVEKFKQSKIRKPLFTTADGVEIFEGDDFVCVLVNTDTQEVTGNIFHYKGDDKDNWVVEKKKESFCFSEAINANIYTHENKPRFSGKEIKDLILTPIGNQNISLKEYQEMLINLFSIEQKEKIQDVINVWTPTISSANISEAKNKILHDVRSGFNREQVSAIEKFLNMFYKELGI